jgi:catechol O-methyltransferase
MGSFDQSKAYAAQEEEGSFFDDGREVELLHFVYSHKDIEKIRGSPQNVLAAIDEYGRTKKYLMNVGEDKGRIVTDLIAEVKPKQMVRAIELGVSQTNHRVQVELGGYVGYSCILFGDAVRKAGGERYFSLERDPAFAAVIMSLVDLAGLSDVVKVIVGSSDESIARLTSSGQLKHIDLMFLDHYKPAYTTDLKLAEELGLITKGSVLAADNVIKPGNPPYLEYVRSSVDEKIKKAKQGGDSHLEGIAETNVKMYEKRYGKANFSNSKGNPNLVYESKLVNSYEPTGVPVSILLHTPSFENTTDFDAGRRRNYQVCWLEVTTRLGVNEELHVERLIRLAFWKLTQFRRLNCSTSAAPLVKRRGQRHRSSRNYKTHCYNTLPISISL